METISNSESFEKNHNGFEETVEIVPKTKKILSFYDQILRLKSPLEIPNHEYLNMAKNRQY